MWPIIIMGFLAILSFNFIDSRQMQLIVSIFALGIGFLISDFLEFARKERLKLLQMCLQCSKKLSLDTNKYHDSRFQDYICDECRDVK
jgi:hypothetical protein